MYYYLFIVYLKISIYFYNGCNFIYNTYDAVDRHLNKFGGHIDMNIYCDNCGLNFGSNIIKGQKLKCPKCQYIVYDGVFSLVAYSKWIFLCIKCGNKINKLMFSKNEPVCLRCSK